MSSVKKFLHHSFKIKDLDTLKLFLGLEIASSKTGISICQRKYTLELLDKFGFPGIKVVSTPMDPAYHCLKNYSPPLTDNTSYRNLIKKSIYLTHS